jgi:hypothetical protein
LPSRSKYDKTVDPKEEAMSKTTAHIEQPTSSPKPPASPGGHGWMMIGCGIMFAVALALIAGGVLRATALIAVVGCTAMMGVMMWMMSRSMGGHDRQGDT